MNQPRILITASLALLLLTACGSSGLGDILGGGTQAPANYEVRGTVESVDTSSRSVILTNVTGYNASMLSSGNTLRVYYSDETPVYYNNQTYRPQDLERGDQIAARVGESGSSLLAESMTVTYNIASGSGTGSGSTSYETAVRGTVRNVDTSRRTVEITQSNGNLVTVEYDAQTPVYYNNQTYRAADLQRGDEVDVRVRSLGSGRYVAEQISVVRSVSGGTSGSPSQQMNTIRGTVVSVDTTRRTIDLQSASWRSNFDTGVGSGSTRIVVSYDANTSVDVSGRLYPVSGLERGDVIDVQVQNASVSMPFATRITLVRDASAN